MKKSCCVAFFALLALVASVGCGGKYPTAAVSGTVTLDGEPLADYQVGFVSADPEAAGLGSSGITDAEGKFTLTATDGRKGAPVGTCKVYVKWNLPESVKQEMANSVSPIPIDEPAQLPPEASDGSTTFEVPAKGTTSANFDF